ncbi:MAG: hypothetical protein IKO07_02090, partial [Clostridia bacterium]|nr:hypothetical protein [Clostridia bacterium]
MSEQDRTRNAAQRGDYTGRVRASAFEVEEFEPEPRRTAQPTRPTAQPTRPAAQPASRPADRPQARPETTARPQRANPVQPRPAGAST